MQKNKTEKDKMIIEKAFTNIASRNIEDEISPSV